MSRPLIERVREAIEALHAAEEHQLGLPAAASDLGLSIEALLLKVHQKLAAIHELSWGPPGPAHRLSRQGLCADAAILLALIGAHPATHA